MFRGRSPPAQVVHSPRHTNTIQNEIKFKHGELTLEGVKAYRLSSKSGKVHCYFAN